MPPSHPEAAKEWDITKQCVYNHDAVNKSAFKK